jgi:hypothetical protein
MRETWRRSLLAGLFVAIALANRLPSLVSANCLDEQLLDGVTTLTSCHIGLPKTLPSNITEYTNLTGM